MWHRIKICRWIRMMSAAHPAIPLLKGRPKGEERSTSYRQCLAQLDALSRKTGGIADEELVSVIDVACDHARHKKHLRQSTKQSSKPLFPPPNS